MRDLVLAVMLVTSGLAGCIGSEDAVDPASEASPSANFTPCEHPWPCADGSEWPTDLTAPGEHPRQPAVIPDTVGIEDGEVVERNAKNVTFEWTVPAETALNYQDGTTDLQAHDETTITVPSGLFLEWTIGFTLTGSGAVDGRQFQLRMVDTDGTNRCTASLALEPTGQDETPRRCTTDTIPPLEGSENWTLLLEHQWDRPDDAEITVTVTGRVSEPAMDVGLDRMEHVYVESHDGTELEGWIFHPGLPEGVEAPVVLHATPYIGICGLGQNHEVAMYEGCGGVPDESWAEAHGYYAPLVSNGYAVAAFSVRGTGGSEGCFGEHSLEEQRDYAHLVDWLGEQDWSNGRVGMMGLSYHGTTPFSAAIHQPDHLKTIVPAGIITDWYTFYASPQGATTPYFGWREAKYDAQNSLTRPVAAARTDGDPSYAPILTERACEEHGEHVLSQSSWVATDERPEAYFDERRLIDHFDNITASVFVSQGLLDNGGHAHQEDYLWGTLENSPKRMLLGQWGHEFPRYDGMLEGSPVGEDWNQDVLIPWMDFWLKGLGDPTDLRLGTVDYEDTSGDWHSSTSWPPTEETSRALYFSGDALAAEPGDETTSFATVPGVGRCGDPATAAAFVTSTLEERLVLAGNPYLYLELGADRPGGVFDVRLLEVDSSVDTCDEVYSAAVRQIAYGGVDLRYHGGNFEGQDFPTDGVEAVRADLHNQAWVLEPGQRLVVLLAGQNFWTISPYTAEVTVHPDSHLVLPVLQGSIGAELPDVDYPPRPFVPTEDETGGGDP